MNTQSTKKIVRNSKTNYALFLLQVHKIVMDDSLSKDQMIEKLRALKVDPALGRSLRGIMFAVAHPRMPHGKPHSTHRNSSHPSAYEGLGPLAVVLGHGGKGDGMCTFYEYNSLDPGKSIILARQKSERTKEPRTTLVDPR